MKNKIQKIQLRFILMLTFLLPVIILVGQKQSFAGVKEMTTTMIDDKGSQQTKTATYNEEGQLIEQVTENKNNTIRIQYTYNENGEIATEVHAVKEKDQSVFIVLGVLTYSYQTIDETTIEIKETYTAKSDAISDYYELYIADLMSFIDVTKEEDLTDLFKNLSLTIDAPKGVDRIIRRTEIDRDGEYTLLDIVFTPDRDKQKASVFKVYVTRQLRASKEKDKVVFSATGEGAIFNIDTNVKYQLNEQMDPIKITDLSSEPYGVIMTKTISYEYDIQGNWTKKETRVKDGRVLNTEKREIQYY